jgi:hypothetical protein
MRLRRETFMTVLALPVSAAALPFATRNTLMTGRVYLFPRQFLEEPPQRFVGPGWFRG